jgi:hypothetical protein
MQDDVVRTAVAVLVTLVLLAGYMAIRFRVARSLRGTRARYAEHPEEVPSRQSRVLRVLPFAVLVAVFTAGVAIAGRWDMVPLGVVGVACFGLIIYRIATGREDQHHQ